MPTLQLAATDLDRAVRAVTRHGARTNIAPAEGLHLAATLSLNLLAAARQCDAHGWPLDGIRDAVGAARAVYAQSPFIRRLQEWPRGYPGDFETVEYILEQRNRATPGTLAYYLEQYALDSPIAQQHRNKVALQAQTLLDAVADAEEEGRAARILVLACGSGADVALVQRSLVRRDVQIVLLDQDHDALAFAMARLGALRDRVAPVGRNVLKGLGSVRDLGPYDLVLAGGLFDYLPDAVAVSLLRYVHDRLLAPGGRMFFTNIAEDDPYRLWIECLGNWNLIHRSAADVSRLAARAGFVDAATEVGRDRTGLALIVSCQRLGEGEAAVAPIEARSGALDDGQSASA
ncbi:MAG: class I SAM-dependent methyltransferase [Vicinamibacterales bacterium]